MRVVSTSIRALGHTLRAALPFAAIATLFALPAVPAWSQGVGIVQQGSAVVTGFSQAVIGTAPPGADPYDYYMANPDGPSARVVDLSNMGAPGVVSPAPKPFTVTASQVGQVFGVALDNAVRPNIYVAATSAYGLEIVTPDASGVLHRIHTGTPGANYAPAQFGPQVLGGGPGSIWRIDGTTGAISLLATVPNAGPAALGGMAFDATSQSLYVVNRSNGIIYRYGTNGSLRGTFDPAVEARPSAGLPPISQPPAAPVNIQSPAFNTENPDTWGYAVPARREFGLAVYKNRLYYSVAQGPQVWSAGIGAGGAIGGKDARLEIELPSLDNGIEIASIDFDLQGYMYVAERGETTGDYFLIRLANDGQSRVVRYRPKLPGDPNPGLWSLTPDQYSIGMPPNYTNADGGVALNYGYKFDGTMDFGACDQTVWASGERLLDPGDGSTGFPTVDGLQGTARSLVQPQNTPPGQSWYVDYDDGAGYADFRGHMGAITTRPCPVAVTPPPPPPPPVFQCPPGTYFDGQQCIIVPTCPAGTSYVNGQCIYPTCPPGFVLNNAGQCIPPPQTCPPGTFYYQGQCVLLSCPPGMTLTPNGQCACPPGNSYFNGKCVPPQSCPVGSIQLPNGICTCPLGLIFGNGVCQPSQQGCPGNQELWNGYCVIKCPPNQIHTPPNGQCSFPPVNCPPSQDYFNGLCVNKCPPGQDHTLPDGMCKQAPVNCPPSQDLFNNLCVAKCPTGQIHTLPNGQCIPPPNCPPTQELWNGICVNKCASALFQHSLPNGACVPIFTIPVGPINPGPIQQLCLGANKEIWEGKCVDKCPGNQVHHEPNGACGPQFIGPIGPISPIGPIQILCLGDNKEIWENKCVDKCPTGQIHKQPNGNCGPNIPHVAADWPDPGRTAAAGIACRAVRGAEQGPLQGQLRRQVPHRPGSQGPGWCLRHAPSSVRCRLDRSVLRSSSCRRQRSAPAQNKDLYNNKCVDKCGPNQEHKAPNGNCGPILSQIQPIQIAPTAAICAAQNKDLYDGKCVDKCGPQQEHKAPNGTCGPILAPIGPIVPLQNVTPTAATCAAQNKDLYDGKCVDKCGPQQEHKAPNGTCGPINIQVKPVVPLQNITPTAATCAAQNKDLYDGKCVDKCGPNQEHKAPNGACGLINVQITPVVPLQNITPTAASCAAQKKDLYNGKCVDTCDKGEEHKAPDGKCALINVQVTPGQLQVVPTAAICSAQDKDLFGGKCVDKCKSNENRNDDGKCVPKGLGRGPSNN